MYSFLSFTREIVIVHSNIYIFKSHCLMLCTYVFLWKHTRINQMVPNRTSETMSTKAQSAVSQGGSYTELVQFTPIYTALTKVCSIVMYAGYLSYQFLTCQTAANSGNFQTNKKSKTKNPRNIMNAVPGRVSKLFYCNTC